jgi:Ca-activated chloride channel homolog
MGTCLRTTVVSLLTALTFFVGHRAAAVRSGIGHEMAAPPLRSGSALQPQLPPPQDFKLRVDVDLVTVDVSVYGTPARELRVDDFTVYDNNESQRLIHFSRDQLPLAVALVVDGSGSLYAYARQLQSAARVALGSLKPEDQVVLFGFSMFPTRLSDLTHDPARIIEKLIRLAPSGTTNIWDAIFVAAHYLRDKAPDYRRALILVSDNGQLIQWGQTGNSALEEALVAGAGVYAIRIPGSAELYAESDTVRMIADESGGEYLDAKTGEALMAALNQSVTKLRMQYTLGFNPVKPRDDGSFHTLRVALKGNGACPDCRVHTRKGYYDGAPALGGTATKRIPPLNDVPALVYSRMTLAAAEISEVKEIPFRASAAADSSSTTRTATKVDLQIDVAGVHFKTGYGLHAANLCIALFGSTADGICYSTDWKVLDLQLREEAYQRTVASGILHSASLRGAPRFITAVVYDMSNGKMGLQRLTMK